jgi:hypothetical protein
VKARAGFVLIALVAGLLQVSACKPLCSTYAHSIALHPKKGKKTFLNSRYKYVDPQKAMLKNKGWKFWQRDP